MIKTTSLLISAMGGEGGGVLTSWIVEAARAAGLAVQATSIPGVAQRTGATTYYVEMGQKNSSGKSPVFSLYPMAGNLDILLSSELLEASRTISKGYFTPGETQVITSTKRTYCTPEKTVAHDNRLNPEELIEYLREHSGNLELWDMHKISTQLQTPISPVMLGALARAEVLPIDKKDYEQAIQNSGKATVKNLAAFNATFNSVGSEEVKEAEGAKKLDFSIKEIEDFHQDNREILESAYAKLKDYQDEDYSKRLLSRLSFCKTEPVICENLIKELTHLMAYEDVIRVAELKTKATRFEKIRFDHRIGEGDVYEIEEFLKPGIKELIDILPVFLGKRLNIKYENSGKWQKLRRNTHLKSSRVWGFLALSILAKLKKWRRQTYRFQQTDQFIEKWLLHIQRAYVGDRQLALEIIKMGELIKGYGETHERGHNNFEHIIKHDSVSTDAENGIEPGIASKLNQVRTELLNHPDDANVVDLLQ